MTYSLYEIEVMAKRAARGAGYHWGNAEEVGKAARWLTEQDLPGSELLAQLLTLNDRRRYDDAAPRSTISPWRAGEGELCPLLAGSALCDHAAEIAGGLIFELEAVAYPLLLAPYVAAASAQTGFAATLSWDQTVLHITPRGFTARGGQDQLMTPRTQKAICQIAKAADVAASASNPVCGRTVDKDYWSALGKLALRTFAPATEASRLAGAGAGITDND